jgi:hypothetical protein
MKIYYYEYSDDQIFWHEGEPSFSLTVCVDNAQRCCYPWRIKQAELSSDWADVPEKEIRKSEKIISMLNKLIP